VAGDDDKMFMTGADLGIEERGPCGEREPITGVWGRSPRLGPGGPGQGVRGRSPLKLKLLDFLRLKEVENLVRFEGFVSSFQSGSME